MAGRRKLKGSVDGRASSSLCPGHLYLSIPSKVRNQPTIPPPSPRPLPTISDSSPPSPFQTPFHLDLPKHPTGSTPSSGALPIPMYIPPCDVPLAPAIRRSTYLAHHHRLTRSSGLLLVAHIVIPSLAYSFPICSLPRQAQSSNPSAVHTSASFHRQTRGTPIDTV
ncbi:hypothetical protein PYCCODRAFT_302677 [Trametes coccinea BRFM310]|uniref:Uncharacterized protein n=1 Tax=Trametes coccinea (strain BRFM310) TaxID=1353009 RepID=A0A1Y2INS4_TRAC3|nr:hypothetical protein PYCCODRAFT_302677 [Trametes coccinea BRFM310]